jgi:hypothetical protein
VDLPNATKAIVDPEKVRDYLLSPSHPVGRFKAVFFRSLGFSAEPWEVLRGALLRHAWLGEATPGEASAFGQKYEVRGTVKGPNGRSAQVVTVRVGEDQPRLVTAYPG